MFSARRIIRTVTAAVTATVTALTMSTVMSTATSSALTIGAPSGVDVSGHQHPTISGINWADVKSDGQSYAFVKATEGETFVNGHFVGDATAARDAGLKVGAYHYARPSTDPAAQAAAFAAQLAQVPGQSLPPVLDLEVAEGKSPEQLIAWTRVFTDELKRLTGRTPMIYTYRYFWLDHMANTHEFSEYPLWLAAYQPTAPAPVGGWSKLAFWQRSESGRVRGITGPVDMNLFNGNDAQLEAFAHGNYMDFGGMLEGLVIPGIDLSGDAGAIIAGILALVVGAAAAPAVIEAAENAGLGTGGNQLVSQAKQLLDSGAITPEQLQRLADSDASVGDLAIWLNNAEHLQGGAAVESAQVDQVAKAARGAGVEIPALDAGAVAGVLNRILAQA